MWQCRVAQVKKLQAEKEKSEGAGDSSLLKVAEVLSSVGAGSFLSSAMGASKKAIPTPVASIGAGAGEAPCLALLACYVCSVL